MPNLANILKAEIARIARKQVRAETTPFKKTIATLRSEVAALKRQAIASEQQLRRLGKVTQRAATPPEEVPSRAFRFSAKGLVAQRRRLGISARECGLLVGASAQSVYNWEEGKVRPRARHLAAIAALKGLGKRGARAHLDSMG